VTVATNHDEWVTIRSFDDPVEAEITQQFLRDHGIPVSILGNSGTTSILNRFTTVLDIRLTVPAARLDDAREALEALATSGADHPFRGKAPAGDETSSLVKRKSAAAAFILACLVPVGGGHFYAQHTAAAIVLGAGIVGGYAGAIVGARPELLAASGLLVALDAVGAIFAVKRYAEGRIPSEARQRLGALVVVVAAFALAIATR
jgi:hypothetical protein